MSGSSSGGRRMPPAHTRFKPGQSGNPKGRPKGAKNLKTVLDQELGKIVTITENGRPVKRTKREVMLQRAIHDSVKGNHRATALILGLSRSLGSEEDSGEANEQRREPPDEGAIPDRATLRRIQRRFAHLREEGDER